MKYEMSKGYLDSSCDMYFQNMTWHAVKERLKKDDVIIIPIGSTENHGMGQVFGEDGFLVSRMAEIVARETGCTVAQPIWYGAHPWNQLGVPGTVVIPDDTFVDYLRAIIAGYWNAGFRKMILLNGHGQEYVIPNAIHTFEKKTKVPVMIAFVNWPTVIAKELRCRQYEPDSVFETPFRHADEVETSYALALFEELNHPEWFEDTQNWPDKHVCGPCEIDMGGDVHQWPLPGHCTCGLGPLEVKQYPEGCVGYPSKASAEKAMPGLEKLIDYMIHLHDEMLAAYPAGELPREMTELDPELVDKLMRGPRNGGISIYAHCYPI